MPASNRRTPQKVDVHPPLSGIPMMVGATILGLGAYLFAESALAAWMHGVHWLAAVVGSVVGMMLGLAVAWAMSRMD